MNAMPAGQYIPGGSVIHRLDAGVKIACLFILMAALVMCSTVYGYLVVLGMLAVIAGLSKLPPAAVLSSIGRLRIFFILIFLMNALFYSAEGPLLSWGIISITQEGIKQGARVVFNVLCIMILANVLLGTTAPMDMTSGLGSLLKPLGLLRIPVEDVAMIIGIAIRFIPALLEEALMIKKAQTARGARFESKKLREKALSFLPLLIPVFVSAFRRADELSLAMEARGYRSAGNRTGRARAALKRCDFAALGFCIFICILQFFSVG